MRLLRDQAWGMTHTSTITTNHNAYKLQFGRPGRRIGRFCWVGRSVGLPSAGLSVDWCGSWVLVEGSAAFRSLCRTNEHTPSNSTARSTPLGHGPWIDFSLCRRSLYFSIHGPRVSSAYTGMSAVDDISWYLVRSRRAHGPWVFSAQASTAGKHASGQAG